MRESPKSCGVRVVRTTATPRARPRSFVGVTTSRTTKNQLTQENSDECQQQVSLLRPLRCDPGRRRRHPGRCRTGAGCRRQRRSRPVGSLARQLLGGLPTQLRFSRSSRLGLLGLLAVASPLGPPRVPQLPPRPPPQLTRSTRHLDPTLSPWPIGRGLSVIA